jgi:DNA polymerase type B, organellar and viral
LDSKLFIDNSLNEVLDSFKCKVKKLKFPHSFVTKERLNYIGEIPEFKYYYNNSYSLEITKREEYFNKYLNLPNRINWNLKNEVLRYNSSELKGLLEALLKFNYNLYNTYSLNITNFVTLPQLALAIKNISFKNISSDSNNEIKLIKGTLEERLRKGYHGGNVHVYVNEILNGYYYDMVSQYPKAMLQDMPVGNPVFTTEKDLDKIFGFVYAKITCPNEEELRVPLIRYKDPHTREVTTPRGTFTTLVFSEELKQVRDLYGYKVEEILYSYQFNRGKDVFTNYIEHFFALKKNAKNSVERKLAKLMLNSLSGKYGQKESENILRILNESEAKQLVKNHNFTYMSKLENGKVMIKYNSKVPEALRKLLKDSDTLDVNSIVNFKDLNKTAQKKMLKDFGFNQDYGIPSAVQISAAITAYGRMSINVFKNIPGNPCIMSDTDSAVLTKPLDPQFVGTEMGQMKLEHVIKHGIFIRKKLYAIKTIDGGENKTIIRSSGVDKNLLTFEDFEKLLKGENLMKERFSFLKILKFY